MKLLSAACSDIGIRKHVNQDAVLIRSAVGKEGEVLLAAVCDGMGGLEKGEVASGEVIRGLSRWFEEKLPKLLADGDDKMLLGEEQKKSIETSLEKLIQEENQKISVYGEKRNLLLGTTVSAILLTSGWYLIVQVGDSRIYELTDKIRQITKDQTYVQREVDAGRLTEKQAQCHPRKNVLLQCIGVEKEVTPVYYRGNYEPGMGFLVCSDGFRNRVSLEELREKFCGNFPGEESEMEARIREGIELNKRRMETDNISAILLYVN